MLPRRLRESGLFSNPAQPLTLLCYLEVGLQGRDLGRSAGSARAIARPWLMVLPRKSTAQKAPAGWLCSGPRTPPFSQEGGRRRLGWLTYAGRPRQRSNGRRARPSSGPNNGNVGCYGRLAREGCLPPPRPSMACASWVKGMLMREC